MEAGHWLWELHGTPLFQWLKQSGIQVILSENIFIFNLGNTLIKVMALKEPEFMVISMSQKSLLLLNMMTLNSIRYTP